MSLGGLWEGSWGVLGGLGALLGGSWGGLGWSCGDLKTTFGAVNFLIVFLIDFGRQKGAQREAFREPKSTKIGPKTSPNLRRFSKAKKLVFNSLLEPSWADLGTFWRPSWGLNLRSGTRGRVFGEKPHF